MDDAAEADLAWDLADLACTLIPEADRVQLYITIGAGYNYSAINTLLGAVGGSDLTLTDALAARLDDWLSSYAHDSDAPRLKALIDSLRSVS